MEEAKVVEFIQEAAKHLRAMACSTGDPTWSLRSVAHDLCIKADRLIVSLANAKPEAPMTTEGVWLGTADVSYEGDDKPFCWVYDRITGTCPEQLLADIVGPQGQGWEPVGVPTYDQRGGWFFAIRRPKD